MSASTAAVDNPSLNRPDAAAAAGAAAANGASAATGAGAGAGNTAANINGEVWSSLLQSVASSRLVPTKDVLILGDPHSGKSTLIELLKTALPTPSSDALANGDDGSGTKTVNGVVLPSGPNGVGNTGNGSAPVMVEMGTGTSEDNIFGQKKNDLALSYSYWDVEDDENEDTVARLGLYQIAGSHRSYHALLKYCLNTKTIADTIVLIVLDWSKPWTFMETLQRWIKVLEGALQQICQEGAVAGAAWSKGKALMDELEEKLSRFLQEYTEPQPHPSLGTASYSEPQSYVLGSSDAQSVLLPLTEGCLTNNTGVPIVIVCTKSDHINSLEREMDYQEETFDYIQQSLRTICLKYGASLFYTSIHHPHTFANLRQYLLHRLLTPSTLNNPQPQPSSFSFKLRAQVVERDQVMVPAGWDSIGKIKVLRPGFDCEGVAEGWELDGRKVQTPEDQAATEGGVATAAGAQQVYEEVIVNPKRSHAPVTIQPVITAEDDQVFLDRFVETLQRANERPGVAMGSAMGGSASGSSHSAHGSVSGPPVVGPLGSGYTSMLNSHHSASPPPAMSASMSGSQSIGRAGGRTISGSNGYDSDDVEGRLKMLASKTKVNGGANASSGMIGPALSDNGLAAANMKLMASMMSQGRSNSGSPPVSGSVGGMAATSGVGSAATVGAGSAAQGQVQTEVLSNFFQSLLTRKTTTSVPGVTSPASGSTSAPSNDP